ncbi:MAG: PPE domain-containing protein [Micromonosporaceae bacterium]|nr:PPE domain-containing protein [Micromonosporaceae bacterium]
MSQRSTRGAATVLTKGDTETSNGEKPPAPDPIPSSNLWDLKADPGAINQAAVGWSDLATTARKQAKTIDTPAQKLHDGEWRGETAETYHAHRVKLTGDVREAATLANRASNALEAAATSLTNAQGRLDTSWTSVTRVCRVTVSGGSVTFHPADAADAKAVNAAIREANDIRKYLDTQLLDSSAGLAKAQTAFQRVSAAWQSISSGSSTPFTMPPEAPDTGVIYDFENHRYIINTGNGDDTVEVRVDPKTGDRYVIVNGARYPVPDGMEITVRTGEGNDTITVPPGAQVNLTLLGSAGDDKIKGGSGDERILAGDGDDTVEAGEGDDRISGGGGGDYIYGYRGDDVLSGGEGNDTLYGGAGDDQLSGGDGRDYLEGGKGDDALSGGAGSDQLSGGRGDDQIRGEAGDDVVYTGRGEDAVSGGTGQDTVYGQTRDGAEERADAILGGETVVHVEMTGNPGDTIIIEGSDEFRERVQDDLDMLRSSPRGQMMLTELDRIHNETGAIAEDWPILGDIAYQGDTIRIKELNEENGYAGNDQNPAQRALGHDNYRIEYNPRFDNFRDGPPAVVLYHEMAHIYDRGFDVQADGRYENPNDPDRTTDGDGNTVGVPNKERQAAGLPIDADGDGDYEIDPDHPFEYTENGLRDELGVPKRDRYGF